MKKILFSVVCLVMVGMQSVNAQVAIAALHHNDSVKIYSAAQIQTAIDAAVAGDTIYLSEGVFGGFTVAKPIAIIGAGQTTGISSTITIGKYGTPTEAGLLLSGLNIYQEVNFRYTVDGARISQCKIAGDCDFSSTNNSGSFSNIEVLLSYIVGTLNFNSPSGVQGITVTNSKIGTIRYDSAGEGGSTFVNCNINFAQASGTGSSSGKNNNFVNSIINNASQGVFKNCLYNTTSTNAVNVDCYQPSTAFSFSEDLDCSLSDGDLQSSSYLGVDGTIVGISGGQVAYTLVMPVAQVTEHSIEVDQAERKLKVSLKLGNK